MPSRRDIDNQKQQLQLYRVQARHYLRQGAIWGEALVPNVIAQNIIEAQQKIAHCKNVLRGWGEEVENLPEDGVVSATTPSLEDTPMHQAVQPTTARSRPLHQIEWHFLRQWVSATTIGWLSFGALTGLLQGWALNRRLKYTKNRLLPFWILWMTLIPVIVVWATRNSGFWGGVAGGLVISGIQWIGLRDVALRAGRAHWLIVNCLGGGLAESIIAKFSGELESDLDIWTLLYILPYATVAALLFGIFSGAVLVWLLHHHPVDAI